MRQPPAVLTLFEAPQAAFGITDANRYLGLAEKSNWLLQSDCPIARCDLRTPGAKRPLWRWRRATLDEFLKTREVKPGDVNPQEYS